MSALSQAFQIKGLTLKNRIVMPPMETASGETEGKPTERTMNHYVKRAVGGAGLIIVEHTYIDPLGKFSPRQLGLYSDENVPAFRELAEAIHEAGAPAVLQLSHAGGRTTSEVLGQQPVSASDAPTPGSSEVPRPLELGEIAKIPELFANAAVRAKSAGFDGLEIHAAHGFLLLQFLSPLTNHRSDQYGGVIENRLRLPLAVLRAVRKAVGEDYPLFCRLGADDLLPGGITPTDGVTMAKALVDAGVDVVDVSGGLSGSRPEGLAPGYFVPQAALIKRNISKPVIAVGGITTAELADEIVRTGKADLVAVGRAMLKDADWAEQALASLG